MSPPRFGYSIGGVGLRWFPREPAKTCPERAAVSDKDMIGK